MQNQPAQSPIPSSPTPPVSPQTPPAPPPHSPISSLQPVDSPSDPEKKKPKKFIFIILIILAIALGATGGVFGYQYVQKQKLFQTQPSPTPVVQQPSPSPDPTADWETYKTDIISFKYPTDWQLDNNSRRITNINPKIDFWIYGNNDSMMNECMKLTSTTTRDNLMIKKYSRVITGEFCSSSDTTPREIWITKAEGDGFAPGIIYNYISTEDIEAEKIFDQILSTFKFIDSPTKDKEKIGYIKSITSNKLTIDYINFIDDNTAPNGYRIDNSITDLTELDLAKDVIIIMQTYSHASDGNFNYNQKISLSEFMSIFSSDSHLKESPYWLEIENEKVVKITEQYIP